MKSVLLIGLGNFGKLFAKQVVDRGHEIMVVDKDENDVNEVMSFVTDAIIGDGTNETFLRSLGVNNYDVCVVAIGDDFQSSLETTSLLKELGASKVVSLANREVQAKFLLRNGADEIIYPEKQIAKWASIRFTSDHILDYIKLDEAHAIFEVDIPEQWMGKTIGEVDIRKKYEINVMAIKKNGDMNLSITPDSMFEPGATLLVLGEYKALQKCFHI